LTIFWAIRGHATEGLWWYEQILNLPSVPSVAESRILNGAALMWYTQGELGRARTTLERALALARCVGDIGLAAQAENLLGHVEEAVGNVSAARDQFTRSVEAFQRLAIPWGVGNGLTGMAAVALATGDAAQAERLIEEATAALRHAGPLFLSLALYVRAILEVRRGNADAAITMVRESLTHIRELHDKFAFVYALVPLAAAAVLKGDDAWAARILGARDAVTERTGVTIVDQSVHDLREARRTRGPCPPRPGSVEPGVCGRARDLDRFVDDGHRQRPGKPRTRLEHPCVVHHGRVPQSRTVRGAGPTN